MIYIIRITYISTTTWIIYIYIRGVFAYTQITQTVTHKFEEQNYKKNIKKYKKE